jgi:hypothetical protein
MESLIFLRHWPNSVGLSYPAPPGAEQTKSNIRLQHLPKLRCYAQVYRPPFRVLQNPPEVRTNLADQRAKVFGISDAPPVVFIGIPSISMFSGLW